MFDPKNKLQRELLERAEPEAIEVLARIQSQRERIYGRRLAREQALALRRESGPAHDMAYGSLAERAISFGRQHPMVCAAALGLGLMLGPRKLLRMATMAMPIVMKLRR